MKWPHEQQNGTRSPRSRCRLPSGRTFIGLDLLKSRTCCRCASAHFEARAIERFRCRQLRDRARFRSNDRSIRDNPFDDADSLDDYQNHVYRVNPVIRLYRRAVMSRRGFAMGMRPEEVYRVRRENVHLADGSLFNLYGKTTRTAGCRLFPNGRRFPSLGSALRPGAFTAAWL